MTDAPALAEPAAAETPALQLEGLTVAYRVKGRNQRILQGLDLTIGRGEAYGLVGESGCGKSTAAFAILRYLSRNGTIEHGRILIDGQDLYQMGAKPLRKMRQRAVAMVYQDPGRALNPSIRIAGQMAEVFEVLGEPRGTWRARSVEMLKQVRISDPEAVLDRYPHQLSGGMQQRVCIAMALAGNPALLILDEPTTGLDATVEAEVLDLVSQLRKDFATSILFISHNLAVVARMCDRVGVLYAGHLIEEGRTDDLFRAPRHPYTAELIRCLPRQGRSKAVAPLTTIPGFLPAPGSITTGCVFAPRCQLADAICHRKMPDPEVRDGRMVRCHHQDLVPTMHGPEARVTAAPQAGDARAPVLELREVSKTFRFGKQHIQAASDISLTLHEGETLGLVGESGSGKTTLGRTVLGLVRPDAGGTLLLDGQPMPPALAERSLAQVKALQIVFQNPDSALNRAHSVRRMIARTIARLVGMPRRARRERVAELAASVRLTPRHLEARPSQLSGGLKQRAAIARAFAGAPRVVICDEPTSALDVSVQAAILNLLVELQGAERVSYIFISHDLGVVRYISDRIAVLYLGRLMEVGPAETVFNGPHHPYTEALLSSVPALDGRQSKRMKLSGEIPSAANPPSGCVFHTRCPRKIGPICETELPPARALTPRHMVRCHLEEHELHRTDMAEAAPEA